MSKQKNKKKELTEKQKRFCVLYSKSLNQRDSAKAVWTNMADNTASTHAWDLLNDPEYAHVRAYADRLIASELNELGVNRESILRELATMGFCPLPKVRVAGQDINVIEPCETLAQELEFQSGLKGDKVKFKAPDKIRALQALDDIYENHASKDDDDSDSLTIIRVGK